MKYCPKCEKNKPLGDFWKAAKESDGKFYCCKICGNAIARDSYYRHNKIRYKRSQAWKKANPEKVREQNRRAVKRGSTLRYMYGITREDFNKILLDQGGKCAICNRLFSNRRKSTKPHVDHEHEKKKRVRGLLCDACNNGIGRFNDRIDLLLSAVEYLRRYLCEC